MKAERSSTVKELSAVADVSNSAFRLSAADEVSAAADVSATSDRSRQGGFSEIFLPLPYENQIHLHRKNRKVIPRRRGEGVFDTIEALCFD